LECRPKGMFRGGAIMRNWSGWRRRFSRLGGRRPPTHQDRRKRREEARPPSASPTPYARASAASTCILRAQRPTRCRQGDHSARSIRPGSRRRTKAGARARDLGQPPRPDGSGPYLQARGRRLCPQRPRDDRDDVSESFTRIMDGQQGLPGRSLLAGLIILWFLGATDVEKARSKEIAASRR